MTAPDNLRSRFKNFKCSPGPDTINDLMESCIVYIRSVVRSTIPRRTDLHDAAESDALDQVWRSLETCKGDFPGFVKKVAKSKSIDMIRSTTTRSKVDQLDDLSNLPDDDESPDLIDLTPDQQTIARMLSRGESERSVMETLGISRRELKTAMAAIAKLYENPEN